MSSGSAPEGVGDRVRTDRVEGLLPDRGSRLLERLPRPGFAGTTCHRFDAPEPPVREAILLLMASGCLAAEPILGELGDDESRPE